jgi:hypothetical protein
VQDAVALKTITNQPLLLTDLPAFNSPVWSNTIDLDVEMVTPAFPGELIDIVPSGIPVINPITGTPIDFDVVGNPREDANGERDIGALQLSLAPFLSLTGTGDGTVDLSWNEPLHHDGLSITKYEIVYSESGSSGSTTITIDPPALTNTISGLTNGTEYNFQVRAVYTGPENGPYSNAVLATPFGSLGTPVVTAVAGNKEVALSWTLPDLGERTFEAYKIMWRIAGTTDYTDALALYNPGTTTTTITGLKNGTTYEFAVGVLASGEFSEKGLATATPFNPAPRV